MKKTGLVITLTMVYLCGGCNIIGFILTPGAYENKIPAEYDFAKHAKQKVLILVEQPGWINAQANLRYYLTEAISRNLIRNTRLRANNLVAYDELADYRSNREDFSLLSPIEAGRALHAEIVLAVTIVDCRLTELGQTGYYKSHLYAQAALFDTAAGTKLWPSEDSRSIKVGFEAEGHNQETAVKRLTNACAHCITRYLYPCSIDNFKIADDISSPNWQSWD
jgi:hypothetical protein